MIGAGRAVPVGEVRGEPLGVDGRRGDDQLEVGPPRQQPLEVAEQEVDVEAALVGLVDDDRVVAAQLRSRWSSASRMPSVITLIRRVARGAVGEAHLVADHVAELGAELRGDPLGDRAGGDPARLGVPDQPAAVRPRRGPARGRSSAAGWSSPTRSRRRRSTTWWSRMAAAMSSRRCADRQLGGKEMSTTPAILPDSGGNAHRRPSAASAAAPVGRGPGRPHRSMAPTLLVRRPCRRRRARRSWVRRRSCAAARAAVAGAAWRRRSRRGPPRPDRRSSPSAARRRPAPSAPPATPPRTRAGDGATAARRHATPRHAVAPARPSARAAAPARDRVRRR